MAVGDITYSEWFAFLRFSLGASQKKSTAENVSLTQTSTTTDFFLLFFFFA